MLNKFQYIQNVTEVYFNILNYPSVCDCLSLARTYEV